MNISDINTLSRQSEELTSHALRLIDEIRNSIAENEKERKELLRNSRLLDDILAEISSRRREENQ